jgi:hypothetical protein
VREVDLMDRIRELSRGDVRLFRNNVGVCIRDGARIPFGLAVGSPDLIGWRRTVITPDMVGQTVAVAVGIEVKTQTGRVRPEQRAFLEHMQAFGALAGVARSVEEAASIVSPRM